MEVRSRRFINTFCACSTGFVARWQDFFAKCSLRLIAGGSCGVFALHLGGVETRTVGEAALHTSAAKIETTLLIGVLALGDSRRGGAS